MPSLDRAAVIAEARQVLARHARTFDLAGRFLGPARRDEAAVVYAFCRLVDDLADESDSPEQADRALAEVETELRGDLPARPLVALYGQLLDGWGIDRRAAHELIAGVRSDLGPVAVADDAELLRYCYRVAGTVGLMMCGVLGLRAARAQPFAVDLGIAMQLTNICRDVAEDAGRGRVYLPADRLLAAADPASLARGSVPRPAIAAVVLDLLDLADRHYRSADAGTVWIPWPSRLAILVAARLYRAIGQVLRARGGDSLRGRAVVSRLAKAGWTAVALVRFLRTLAPAERPAHDPALHRHIADLPGADHRASATPPLRAHAPAR
ncbi:MAG: phytoene/squalene synthase family protein [Myxococcales bacterium]|nr:phytoene/squalene synthase family protein [Myxococcales bacterium]